jgi:hypothetical protein
MALGTWQGLYLFEHRDAPHNRRVVAHLLETAERISASAALRFAFSRAVCVAAP